MVLILIKKMNLLNKKKLEKRLNLKFSKKSILITFHPETIKSRNENKNNLRKLLKSLKHLKETTIIFTMPGADTNFKMVVKEIKKLVKTNKKAYFFKFLGDELYFA